MSKKKSPIDKYYDGDRLSNAEVRDTVVALRKAMEGAREVRSDRFGLFRKEIAILLTAFESFAEARGMECPRA